MIVKLIENTQDFLKLQEDWNNILKKSYANFPFLTFEWLLNWWKYFGGKKQLFIMTAHENDNKPPHAIAPFMLVEFAGFKIIQFIGTERSDYLDFIIEDRIEDTIKAFFTFLNENKEKWDVIFLSDILPIGDNIERFCSTAKTVNWGICSRLYYHSPFLPINSDWPQFLSSKSSNFRYSLRRKENYLKKQGMSLKILKLNSEGLGHQVFKDMVEIEKNSWKVESGTPNMQEKTAQNFFLDYLQEFAENGWMNLWLAYMDEKPMAYLINFDYGRKIWFYNAAYHKQSEKYGIGSILMHHAVKDAFLSEKTEYDFMRGVEEYKKHWASEERKSFQLVFYRKSFRSIIGYFVLFRLRWFLSKFGLLRNIRLFILNLSHKMRVPDE